MYLFQVLPLLPWTSEFSKIMIIMYLCHCFPLTSHIRGHLLSAKMALLRLSVDIPHVGIQKESLDWSGLNTIDGRDLWCIFLRTALYIFIIDFGLHMRLSELQLVCHTWVFALQPTYTCICEFPLSNSRVIRKFPILIPAYNLKLKNINRD